MTSICIDLGNVGAPLAGALGWGACLTTHINLTPIGAHCLLPIFFFTLIYDAALD